MMTLFQYHINKKCVCVCSDDGNRSSRSTVVESSYVQKTDSESLYFALLHHYVVIAVLPPISFICLCVCV